MLIPNHFMRDSKWCNVSWYPLHIFYHCSLKLRTPLIHVVVKGRKDGSYMEFMGSFGYTQMVRWCCNIKWEIHSMSHIFALLRDMCKQYQQCISLMQYFTEHEGWVHGKTKIQASWRWLVNGCIPLKIQHFVCAQQLVRFWQDAFVLSGHHQALKSFLFPLDFASTSKREVDITLQ